MVMPAKAGITIFFAKSLHITLIFMKFAQEKEILKEFE
jgi:hypothetical protein